MQNPVRAVVITTLTLITMLVLIHLISAFVFRNLVIENHSKFSKNLQLPSKEEFEEHEVKFFKALFGLKNLEQRIHLWYFPILRDDDIPPTILFCSPSAATLPRLQKMRHLANALSSNLVMFEYRPNGSSSGIISPSLATLTEDVIAVIDWLRREKNVNVGDIILMGYSLGGLPAISAARKFPEIKRLALVNSFCSFTCITAERFSPLLSTLMFFRDFFPDLTDTVKSLTQTVAIIYSDNDSVIPRKCTEQMVRAFQNTSSKIEFQIVGGHSVFRIEKEQLLSLRGFLGINEKSDDVDVRITSSIKEFNDHEISLQDDQI